MLALKSFAFLIIFASVVSAQEFCEEQMMKFAGGDAVLREANLVKLDGAVLGAFTIAARDIEQNKFFCHGPCNLSLRSYKIVLRVQPTFVWIDFSLGKNENISGATSVAYCVNQKTQRILCRIRGE